MTNHRVQIVSARDWFNAALFDIPGTVNPSSSAKALHRVRRSVVIGTAISSVILLIAYVELFREPATDLLLFRQDAWICTKCGLQSRTTKFSLFGAQGTSERNLQFKPLVVQPGEHCPHLKERLGTRVAALHLHPWRKAYGVGGFPDGDPFYGDATLFRAMDSIARTNQFRAEILVNNLYRLRTRNPTVVPRLLPSLRTGNFENLVVELKGQDFNDVAMSN